MAQAEAGMSDANLQKFLMHGATHEAFLANAIKNTGWITCTMFPITRGACSDEARASILSGVLISSALIAMGAESEKPKAKRKAKPKVKKAKLKANDSDDVKAAKALALGVPQGKGKVPIHPAMRRRP